MQRCRVTTSCRLKLVGLNECNEFKGANKEPDQVALVQNHNKVRIYRHFHSMFTVLQAHIYNETIQSS